MVQIETPRIRMAWLVAPPTVYSCQFYLASVARPLLPEASEG